MTRVCGTSPRDFGIDLEIDLDAEQTQAFALERRLRRKLP